MFSSYVLAFSRVRDGRYPIKYGIVDYSPLMDLRQEFDIVMDIPLEEFHLIKEGLTKAMFNRVLQGQSRAAKEVQEKFTEALDKVRVFSELPRRSRSLDQLGHFKGVKHVLLG